MSYVPQYLSASVNLIKLYKGEVPFHLYLKKYFALNKKYGSRDRKQIASLCYNYFRLGHAGLPTEEKILTGNFLCNDRYSEILQHSRPEWNEHIEKPLHEKLSIVGGSFTVKYIFPFADELSEGIDQVKFNQSFLIQPDLFLRIRQGNHKRVKGKLSGAGISYRSITEDCIALPNASKIDTIIDLDKEAVVQDYNSQRTGDFIKLINNKTKSLIKIWDCCAASGGKSLMAYDILPAIDLTVSDKREAILQNLQKRFQKAGIKNYHSFVVDLSGDDSVIKPGQAANRSNRDESLVNGPTAITTEADKTPANTDLIICDAPCTGSGTWSRTPEQLNYFERSSIEKYSDLQKRILLNVIPQLKPGGHLLYITCSVFKKENEDVVKFIQEKSKLQLIKMEMLKGYEIKADTLFAALFASPLT